MSTTEQNPEGKPNLRKLEKPCKVEGCQKHAHYSSGLCAMHHRRLQRKGDVGSAVPWRKNSA